MKTNLNKLPFKYFPLMIILVYAPFHLLEEAWFNIPQWMFEHYKLPQPLSYPHWLINNFVFLVVLVAGLMIFFKNPQKNRTFGVGIIFWALMNSMEHLVFSLYDLQLSQDFSLECFFW